jgi:cytochrome c peroxidase
MKDDPDNRDLYSGMIRLRILHHAETLRKASTPSRLRICVLARSNHGLKLRGTILRIAQVEARVDAFESEALTQASQVYPDAPEAVVVLGKLLFFDKNLSVNRNTACGFCHVPETGFQGGIELINRTSVNQPGSVRTRFSLRKPPSAAYAAFSPPLQYPMKPGEAKCSDCFIGGNFWDLRATGLRLGNSSASQAQGSPLNPGEMANREPACVVRRISQRPYRTLFERVFWATRLRHSLACECRRSLLAP